MTKPLADCGCGTCLTCTAAAAGRAVADPMTFRHGAIKARMLSRISSAEVEGSRPLDALGTRDDDDPTIALVDAVAGALHMLAWNAARLSDDASIQRTEDRDALLDLTRLLGYTARPALAATTTLAFTVDPHGTVKETTIPKGTKVASVPHKDEKPQVFETDADLLARVEWNELVPVQDKSTPPLSLNTPSITIAGVSTPAKAGDMLIASLHPDFDSVTVSPSFVSPGATVWVTVGLVDPAPVGGFHVQLASTAPDYVEFSGGGTFVIPAGQTQATETGTVTGIQALHKITVTSARDSQTVDLWSASSQPSWLCARIANVARHPELDPPRTVIDLAAPPIGLPSSSGVRAKDVKDRVVILGQRASAFGASAPDMTLMPSSVQTTSLGVADSAGNWEWQHLEMPSGGDSSGGSVDLDALHSDAIAGRLVLFSAGTTTALGQVTKTSELSRKGFGLAAKITRIEVSGIDLSANGFAKKVRDTAIYIETSRDAPLVLDKDVAMPGTPSDRLVVKGSVTLPTGRRVVFTGEQWTSSPGSGSQIAEVALVKSATPSEGNTQLVFEAPVVRTFRSTKLKLLANAVSASHGERTPTIGSEVLGSGSASRPSPTFALKRSPLAYVPADNARGYAPAIEVRVDDRLYKEVPTLFGLDSEDRAYAVGTSRAAAAPAVQFAGRLPSGTHNVTALYRTGGGSSGNLEPGRITSIMTPVLGVKEVTNPVEADGASDAETIDGIRTGGPQSIRTLDRVVSLGDFEAFARGYRGVGKALATELHVGMRKVVVLTVATTTLRSPGTDLVKGLKDTLARIGAPGRIVRVEGFTDLNASVTVALAIDPTRTRAIVENAVRTRLVERFGREARPFSEALHRSAILAAVQGVDGVIASRLTNFTAGNLQADAEGRLVCPIPAIVNGAFVQAGLLSVGPGGITLTEMNP